MTSQEALAQLQANPKSFLKNYMLITERAVPGDTVGTVMYYMVTDGQAAVGINPGVPMRSPRTGITGDLATKVMKGARNFRLAATAGRGMADATPPVSAWHLPVDSASALGGHYDMLQPVLISRTSGPNLMVTTLLNGCTFVCEGTDKSMALKHLQPGGGISAPQVCAAVLANGHFGGSGGAPVVFGCGNGYDHTIEDATVIGVRRSGVWKIYAQVHLIVGSKRQIKSVTKLFEL